MEISRTVLFRIKTGLLRLINFLRNGAIYMTLWEIISNQRARFAFWIIQVNHAIRLSVMCCVYRAISLIMFSGQLILSTLPVSAVRFEMGCHFSARAVNEGSVSVNVQQQVSFTRVYVEVPFKCVAHVYPICLS